jgi:hypothetical protein
MILIFMNLQHSLMNILPNSFAQIENTFNIYKLLHILEKSHISINIHIIRNIHITTYTYIHIYIYIFEKSYISINIPKITYFNKYTQKIQKSSLKIYIYDKLRKIIFTKKAQFFVKDHIKA